ncbi:MAG: molybdenum cofactor guanylyltransferase [Bacteroidales bacterium]|nr:molybdenum cofactor guanylyltransferase [Bacteroidales bacterium]
MYKNISGVILAGGDNKRFGGQPKAKIIIGGRAIISRIAVTIEDIFDEIIIVTNVPAEFKEFSHFRIISDLFQNAGPLGGLHAAMKTTSKEAVFVFAGDMPFLEKQLITNQINRFAEEKCNALVPQVNDFTEPLHSIYSNSILNKLEKYLNEGTYAVREFLERIDVKYMRLPDSDVTIRSFTNINYPSDLIAFETAT